MESLLKKKLRLDLNNDYILGRQIKHKTTSYVDAATEEFIRKNLPKFKISIKREKAQDNLISVSWAQ